jgi:membrane-associated two-gene conflict system component 1 (EACC1)
MTVELRVHLTDSGQLDDLGKWLDGPAGVVVRTVSRPPEPNSQGTVWDFLSVVCAAGGPVVAAVRALQLWIEARVTVVEIKVGDRHFTVRSQDARAVLQEIIDVARALESAPEMPDEPSE